MNYDKAYVNSVMANLQSYREISTQLMVGVLLVAIASLVWSLLTQQAAGGADSDKQGMG